MALQVPTASPQAVLSLLAVACCRHTVSCTSWHLLALAVLWQLYSRCQCLTFCCTTCIYMHICREEVRCRFCSSDLPDWKLVLCGSAHTTHCCSVVPVVAVIFAGQEYRLAVQPTADGLQRFKKQVEVITGVPFTDGLDVRFFCRSPTGGNYGHALDGPHPAGAQPFKMNIQTQYYATYTTVVQQIKLATLLDSAGLGLAQSNAIGCGQGRQALF